MSDQPNDESDIDGRKVGSSSPNAESAGTSPCDAVISVADAAPSDGHLEITPPSTPVKSSVISPVLSPSKGPSEVLGETRATTVRRMLSRAASLSVNAIAVSRSFPRWRGQSRARSLAGDRG